MRNHLLLSLVLLTVSVEGAFAADVGVRVGADVPGPSIEAGPLLALDAGPSTIRIGASGGVSPTFKLASAEAVIGSRATKLSPLSVYGGIRDELIIGRDRNTNRIGLVAGFGITPPKPGWLVEVEGIAYARKVGGALSLRFAYLFLSF